MFEQLIFLLLLIWMNICLGALYQASSCFDILIIFVVIKLLLCQQLTFVRTYLMVIVS